MALVHELLYKSKNLSEIQISDYISRLGNSIHDAFSIPESQIKIIYKIEKNIFFNVDLMIPLGLIINEILSNSFKYAFPKNRGNIAIELREVQKCFELIIKDDGIGFFENYDSGKNSNLGIQLIHMLIDQIEGTLHTNNENGTIYLISFKNK